MEDADSTDGFEDLVSFPLRSVSRRVLQEEVQPGTTSLYEMLLSEFGFRDNFEPSLPQVRQTLRDQITLFRGQLVGAGASVPEADSIDRIRNIGLRYVIVRDRNAAEQLLQTADNDGRGLPSRFEGLCIDPGRGFAEKHGIINCPPTEYSVMFIYDMGKLQQLSPEEAAQHVKFSAGYGYKPTENSTFRAALLGALILEPEEAT